MFSSSHNINWCYRTLPSLTDLFIHGGGEAVLGQLYQSRYSCKMPTNTSTTLISLCANSRVRGGAALVQQAAPSLWQSAHRCRCGSVCGTAAGSLCSTHTTPHRRRSTHTDAPTPANTAETHHGSAMWGTCDRFNISHEKNSNRINLQVMQLTYNYDQDEIITSFIFHHNWQKNRESRRFNHSVSFLVNRVNWVWADGGNIQENPTLGTKMFISICFILVSF